MTDGWTEADVDGWTEAAASVLDAGGNMLVLEERCRTCIDRPTTGHHHPPT